jgi:PIN domain nuclease of toxin-antitoxin system
MDYLADTHTALWFLEDSPQLSKKARKTIANPNNRIMVSIASVWELAIKIAIKKLEFQGNSQGFVSELRNNNIDLIDIEPRHIAGIETLPFHHRDPFDRLLVTTAMAEQIPIITIDENMPLYDVECIW